MIQIPPGEEMHIMLVKTKKKKCNCHYCCRSSSLTSLCPALSVSSLVRTSGGLARLYYE